MMRRFARGVLVAAAAAWMCAAHAGEWPDRPIRMIVPYPPGGATDVAARLYAQHMGDYLKQSVVVENKAGAGGELGAEYVAHAPPDGYTVLMGALGSLAINAAMLEKQNYSFAKDYKGVSVAITMPMALAVSTKVPAHNLAELVALAKQRPGRLTFGSAGTGSSQHMAGELFKQVTGTDILHVPYRGSGPAVTDLLGGQIDMVIETLPALIPQAGSGKIRILAVSAPARVPSLPDVPTFAEAGVQGYAVATTYALLAPAGTPPAAIEKMSLAMQQAGKLPAVRQGGGKAGRRRHARFAGRHRPDDRARNQDLGRSGAPLRPALNTRH
ncbi:Bug family tripartite tricarboxylate transporter substrate binding protein [Bordetella genomosp. 10]|uniref:Bug family tripartite tricarboxylate transporter substrate binding protein n=1 Tax=Bordetella genomosp. 10 TaxID=1416804 RepID=UPI00211B2EDA|nr:tripartite tricarboxylate transporter substrate binding protein [Bordetella genomosp. 10]